MKPGYVLRGEVPNILWQQSRASVNALVKFAVSTQAQHKANQTSQTGAHLILPCLLICEKISSFGKNHSRNLLRLSLLVVGFFLSSPERRDCFLTSRVFRAM